MAEKRESLGQRIRLHRQSQGETQEQLALRLGICRSTLISWEHDDLPQPIGKLIEEMYEVESARARVYQLQLPFDEPIDLEVRIAPKKSSTLQVDVEWKQKSASSA